MASRSRTSIFMRYRDTLRTHKRGPRTNTELRDFKVQKNLLAAQSDDECSTAEDMRVYSVPPVWVTMVDDMNRDISQIKIKSARRRSARVTTPSQPWGGRSQQSGATRSLRLSALTCSR